MNIKKEILCEGNFDIKTTHAELEVISKVLKTEFIGIDDQIDQTINSIKPWLFFRDTLGKPLVINLWGLTGCGKTKLIDRLLTLLKLKYGAHRINASELNDAGSLRFLMYNHDRNNDHPIVILDEFQNYKAKDAHGEELDEYNSILWDYIDTGMVVFDSRYDFGRNDNQGVHACHRVLRALYYLNNNTYKNLGFTITKGENDRMHKVFSSYDDSNEDCDKSELVEIGGEKLSVQISDETLLDIGGCFDEHLNKSCSANSKSTTVYAKYTLKPAFMKSLKKMLNLFDIATDGDFDKELYNYTLDEFTEFIGAVKDNLLNGNKKPTLDYSKSLIFVLGNVDAAYSVHNEFNPDISADEFYKMTKKITIVEIKEALLHHFRAEHIARLGNTHIIYPSLSSKSYKTIIENNLNEYSKNILKQFNIDLKFDQSIHQIVYKENVFPVLGVRSLQSGINDMIKSNFANTLLYKDERNIDCDTIEYRYKSKKIEAYFYKKGDLLDKTTHKLTLRVESLRDNKQNDQQALVAIHETGHSICEIVLFNKLPISVYSVTADSSSGGFMWSGVEDDRILNKELVNKHVITCLGGRAAELIVFGDNMLSTGASADMEDANEYLFNSYRKWGFHDSLLVRKISLSMGENDVAKEYEKDTIQEQVNDSLNRLLGETRELLEKHKELLLQVGYYLSKHSTISRKKLLEYIKKYSDIDVEKLRTENENMNYGYKSKLEKALKKLSGTAG